MSRIKNIFDLRKEIRGMFKRGALVQKKVNFEIYVQMIAMLQCYINKSIKIQGLIFKVKILNITKNKEINVFISAGISIFTP